MNSDMSEAIDALLGRYVAGELPLPARVLVESHLAIKPGQRALVRGLEAMAGDALDAADPVPLADRQRRLDAILAGSAAEIEASAHPTGLFPKVLHDFVGFRVEDVPWRTKLPGFREYDIGEFDGFHASLFWIRAGRKIPSHTHEGSELTLVLDGDFSDIAGRYGRGDISIADDKVDHRPIAGTDRACIGFAVTDGPLRLTGPLRQRLGDIIGR